jgi:hypothetical protein
MYYVLSFGLGVIFTAIMVWVFYNVKEEWEPVVVGRLSTAKSFSGRMRVQLSDCSTGSYIGDAEVQQDVTTMLVRVGDIYTLMRRKSDGQMKLEYGDHTSGNDNQCPSH